MAIWRPDIFYNYIGIWRHLESFSICSTDLSQAFVEVINFLWNPGGNGLRPISNQYKLRPKDPRACMLFVWFQLFGDITAWCWYISYTPLIHGSFEAFYFLECVLSHVWLFAIPWTLACQAPLSMEFPVKNTGMGCHALLLPDPGIKSAFFTVWATSIKICIRLGGAY